MYVYLVLERGFLRTFGQHSKSFTKHCHVENNYPSRFAKKSSFIGQGKNTQSIETVIENLPLLFVIWKSTTLARDSWRKERSKKNYKKISHWQPSLFTLLPAVRRLNTRDSNSQSDKSLLCFKCFSLFLLSWCTPRSGFPSPAAVCPSGPCKLKLFANEVLKFYAERLHS